VRDTGDEPLSPRPVALLGAEGAGRLAEGLAILKKTLPAATVHVALDRSNRALLNQLHGAEGIHLHSLPGRYPQHQEEVLLPMVIGGEDRFRYPAIHSGVLVLDLQGVLQVQEAVIQGRPLMERVIALSGPGFKENLHVRARIGTPIREIVTPYLKDGPVRIVSESVMSGETVDDLEIPLGIRATQLIALPLEAREILGWARPGFLKDSISRTFVANFVPASRTADTNLHGEHRPCISCTFCDQVCPVGILPHLLHRFVQRGIIDESLPRYRVQDCIGCNLCSYVCPCKIPIAALLAEGQKKAVAEGLVTREQIRHRFAIKGLDAAQAEAEL
jgi:Na(+)-translocating NADH:ubiquinone oxidoreductase A subunit